MEQKTVAFCTLGCKVNQYETNAMMQNFIQAGYGIVEFEENLVILHLVLHSNGIYQLCLINAECGAIP